MITAFKLAGFFAAHAIWCISDAETLTPILAYTTVDDVRKMEQIVMDDLAASVKWGRRKLQSNEMDATDAVLLYDGRIPLGATKIDAIIIEIRAYFSRRSVAIIAIPYTHKKSERFLVHKPKLLAEKNCGYFDMNAAWESFFAGIGEHEKGSKIWNAALDESK